MPGKIPSKSKSQCNDPENGTGRREQNVKDEKDRIINLYILRPAERCIPNKNGSEHINAKKHQGKKSCRQHDSHMNRFLFPADKVPTYRHQ